MPVACKTPSGTARTADACGSHNKSIVFGFWLGNQTGLQNTGRNLPDKFVPRRAVGNKTTFFPSASAAALHSIFTNHHVCPAACRRDARRINPNIPVVGNRRARSETVTVSLPGAWTPASDALIAPSGVNLPVGTVNAGSCPPPLSRPCSSLIDQTGCASVNPPRRNARGPPSLQKFHRW